MKYTTAQMRAAIQKERERDTPTDAYRDAAKLADMLEQLLEANTTDTMRRTACDGCSKDGRVCHCAPNTRHG